MLTKMSVNEIKDSIKNKIAEMYGCTLDEANDQQIYTALAYTVRYEIMKRRAESHGERKKQGTKKLYYLSAEFLLGRALHCNIVNLLNEDNYRQALSELGINRDSIFEEEPEPGLGNGGLGRLAACFMDSLATLNLPAIGCTIRYEYGLFRQKITGGYQVEVPDNWLDMGNIWEIPHPEETVDVYFGGRVEEYKDNDRTMYRTVDATMVEAVPFDIPMLGYDTTKVDMIRTWAAYSPKRFNMDDFNRGDYLRAMAERELAEVISKVLYPNDNSAQGKELRLKQQYFFCAASVAFLIKDFVRIYGRNWAIFSDKVAIHINDTHPAIAIPEMMRVLMDEYGLGWDQAEKICRETFAYTNHTVMAEALEKWPEDLIRRTLPRVYMIMEELNRRLCAKLWDYYPGQWERIGHMAILAYSQVHMANLAVAYSHSVNGVSAIHTEILKKQTFRDYYVMKPEKFTSITNGITHRRWLIQANPALADLLDEAIGVKWRKDPLLMSEAAKFADDAAFRDKFYNIKQENKRIFADRILRMQGTKVDPETMFDSQAKRLHEYKRQLMNAIRILMLYNKIVSDPKFTMPPTTYIFGAKASPAYTRAKLIIKLINTIGDMIKKHPRARKMLNIVFLENYCVSSAEYLVTASDVSEQLSTAGKEASGTGNMKFMMNGAVTIGTMDGANCEIYDQVGADNIYIFGLSAEEVEKGYSNYRASEVYETQPELRHAMLQLIDGTLSPDNPRLFSELHHALLFGDYGSMADPYFVLKDMNSYCVAHRRLESDYLDRDKWVRSAVINTAMSGIFSSDRTIAEYNEKIWHINPLAL